MDVKELSTGHEKHKEDTYQLFAMQIAKSARLETDLEAVKTGLATTAARLGMVLFFENVDSFATFIHTLR